MNHRYQLTLLALAGTLFGATVAAGAQTTQAPPPTNGAPQAHHRGLMGRAMVGLNLSDAQKAQIRAAQQKFHAARKTSTPETHQQLMSDVEAALTPAQRTQFESNMKTMRAQMRADRSAQGAPAAAPSPAN